MNIKERTKLFDKMFDSDQTSITDIAYDVFDVSRDKSILIEEYDDLTNAQACAKSMADAVGVGTYVVKVTTTIEFVKAYPE